MPKTKQSAALGSLSDFSSATIPQQETDAERITSLERRVATLEGLLADVMLQLDKAHSQPKAKQQVNGKPKTDATSAHNAKHQKAALALREATLANVLELLADGQPRKMSEIVEALDISRSLFSKISKKLAHDGAAHKERLYTLPEAEEDFK